MPAPIAARMGAVAAKHHAGQGSGLGDDPLLAANMEDGNYHREHDGMFGASLAQADAVGQKFFMADFMLPMAAGAITFTLGNVPGAVGRSARTFANGLLKAPIAALKETTIGDLMARPAALPANYFSNLSKLTEERGMGSAKFARAAEALGGASVHQMRSEIAASSGMFQEGVVQSLAAKRAKSMLTGLHGETGTLVANIGKPMGLLADLKTKAGRLVGHAAPMDELSPKFAEFSERMKAFQGALAGDAHLVNAVAANEHLQAARAALNNIAAHASVDKLKVSYGEQLTSMEGKLKGAAEHLMTARGGQTVGTAAATAAKSTSLWNVGFKGGMALGAGYYGVRTIRHFNEAVGLLEELNQDLTGKSIGFWDVLTSKNLSPLVQEARANMLHNFMPEAISAAASAGLNLLFMKQHPGMKEQALLGGAIITQMSLAGEGMRSHFLENYAAIKDMQKLGHQVPPELYAQLIDASCAQARDIGGCNNKLVQAVAEDCAKEQISAVDLLREIDDGVSFNKRAEAAMKRLQPKIDAEKPAPHITPQVNIAAAQHEGRLVQGRIREDRGQESVR